MSKSLEIAEQLHIYHNENAMHPSYCAQLAAAELRRLHELNAEFVAVCESVIKNGIGASDLSLMRKLVDKAKEQS